MSAIVFDSCVMQRYAYAIIFDQAVLVRGLVDCIAADHAFAMDIGGKMQHQWLETCGVQVFGEIFFQWLREGKIELFKGSLHEQHKKHLSINCGFPFTVRHEGVFVGVAAEAFPHILVGDDLDFWEPTEKGCPAERRRDLMTASKGAVCRYLRKELEVQVVTVEQAIKLLSVQV